MPARALRGGDVARRVFLRARRATQHQHQRHLALGYPDPCIWPGVDGTPVDKANLSTRFPDVYAVGDVTSAPVPKAGIFAESAARAVAEHLIVKLRNQGTAKPYDGAGSCFIEFGDHRVGRVDADFLTGPSG